MLRKIFIFFIFIFIIIQSGFSIPRRGDDYAKGPLWSKNIFCQYIMYYNLNGMDAGVGKQFEFQYYLSMYYTQEFFVNYTKMNWENRIDLHTYDYKECVLADFESLVTELGASFFLFKNLQVGMALRVISYYGGFLDSFVQNYHYTFGFPNGAREFFPQNNVYVNVETNINIYLDKPTVSFGDIDTWIKYNMIHIKMIDLALLGALKIPTGSFNKLSGSGYPDFAAAILLDFKPVWFISFYIQNGIVIPLDVLPVFPTNPYPMYNGIFCIELNPFHFFSLLVQLNVKTPPFTADVKYINNLSIETEFFSQPQTNILVGLIFQYKKFKWQIYFEEDAFTNAGTDFTFNIMFSHSLKFF